MCKTQTNLSSIDKIGFLSDHNIRDCHIALHVLGFVMPNLNSGRHKTILNSGSVLQIRERVKTAENLKNSIYRETCNFLCTVQIGLSHKV